MAASLPDLPDEIFRQIAKYLDNETLCALGSTCRSSNGPIFAWFFYKHGFPMGGRSLSTVRHNPPSFILRALRCSLVALNSPFDDFQCTFEFDDPDKPLSHVIEQVDDLRVILRRAKKIERLVVYLYSLDSWTELEGPTPDQHGYREWMEALIALLTTAINQGCGELRMNGGDFFHEFLEAQGGAGNLTASTPGQIMNSIAVKPGLQVINLSSNTFFTTRFINWTIQMVTSNAKTLVDLEVGFSEDLSSSAWHEFAQTAHLPHLTRFTMRHNLRQSASDDFIQFFDVALFLARHPSIQQLYLYDLPSLLQPARFPKFKKPILPNLEFLEAPLSYVQWIFRGKTQHPHLDEVVVSPESCSPCRSSSLALRCGQSCLDCTLKTMKNCQPSERFGFNFTSGDLDGWIRSHLDLGPLRSALSHFTGPWRELIVKFPLHHGKRSYKEMALFIQWVALFPDVECLVLNGLKSDYLTSQSRLALLHALAPKLKTLVPSAGLQPICICRSLEAGELVYSDD